MTTAPGFSKGLQRGDRRGPHARSCSTSAGVEFIDSTGLSVLLNGLRQVTQARRPLALVCANPTVLRLFEITSLDQTFDIFAGRERGLRARRAGSVGRRQLRRRAVGRERRRQRDRAVLALAVLQQRDDRAADGDRGAVERVQRLGLAAASPRTRISRRRAWKSVVLDVDVSSR